jgi:hypothetical protein
MQGEIEGVHALVTVLVVDRGVVAVPWWWDTWTVTILRLLCHDVILIRNE